ncbi:GapR family DNA-binding domain-containing protein [uncultured Rhodospira sp.]|uniref:DUF2312 domain-containing protein n=1 Tax=uncultured Rhodospira sp. TaxID=1936189 RepID=UPI002629EFF0|nr:GapR family DNA-binding domain-containing protein [uncultured Rhodospira sp.]
MSELFGMHMDSYPAMGRMDEPRDWYVAADAPVAATKIFDCNLDTMRASPPKDPLKKSHKAALIAVSEQNPDIPLTIITARGGIRTPIIVDELWLLEDADGVSVPLQGENVPSYVAEAMADAAPAPEKAETAPEAEGEKPKRGGRQRLSEEEKARRAAEKEAQKAEKAKAREEEKARKAAEKEAEKAEQEARAAETETETAHERKVDRAIGGNSGPILMSYLGRIEALNEEVKEVQQQVKEVYAEAKGGGWDPKTIRKLVALRKQDADAQREELDMFALYLKAIGIEW